MYISEIVPILRIQSIIHHEIKTSAKILFFWLRDVDKLKSFYIWKQEKYNVSLIILSLVIEKKRLLFSITRQ